MSVVTEKKTYPAKTIEEVTAIICELCGVRGRWGDWHDGFYDRTDSVLKATVRADEGTVYPEGGTVESVCLDICPECFKSKLIPWFTAQGGQVRKVEREE